MKPLHLDVEEEGEEERTQIIKLLFSSFHLDQLLQPVWDEDSSILSHVPNVTSLHPSDDDDDDDIDVDAVDDDDDNNYGYADDVRDHDGDPPPPIICKSLCIGLRVVQVTKHHSVPRHLQHGCNG